MHVVRLAPAGCILSALLLATGAKPYSLLGRNEEGGQLFHRWLDAIVETDDDALPELLAKGIG